MTDRPTVAVIGAGFSGLLTTVRLLLAPDRPRVLLIERGARFARGAAYATSNSDHLLNVRATNMSAFVEQPGHFIQWLADAGVPAAETMFVTRDRYGQYLQSILRRIAGGESAGRLVLEPDEAMSAAREAGRWAVKLAMGRTLRADVVVLALGNLPPPAPQVADAAVLRSPRYIADPWAWDTAASPPGEVLLLGSGLTAVDVALTFAQAGGRGRVTALSRHGLLPRAHGEAAGPPPILPAPEGSPARALRELRRGASEDWRGAIDGLRPHVQGVWRGWDLAHRRQALRHLRPWWDVHRHRLAPAVAERLASLQDEGRFAAVAGRLTHLRLTDQGLDAGWRPRGGGRVRERRFALAINCAGPRGDWTGTGDPLIGDLLAAGHVRPDACRLGLDVDARSRAVGADGAPAETLFAVGPITRGQFYEITSVPDIRIQAADCATAILNVLAVSGAVAAGTARGPARVLDDLSAYLNQNIDELEVELGSLKFARRLRNAWELRGRKAALGEIALWLEKRRAPSKDA